MAVNQIAATTGAVVRNFFMGSDGGDGAEDQRGETVTLASSSVSFPLVNSPKAARGQVADAKRLLNAMLRSIWISFMAAFLPRVALRY